jgi:MacB-like periplasmic core domain/FtsX-like permease family
MSTALYWWRAAVRRTWRPLAALVLLAGLLGAVALAAAAGAWRTDTAYGRYLRAANVSDAFVNVPGELPGMPATRPITLISRLPGVTASAPYLGLAAAPVIHGHIRWGFLTASVNGALNREWYQQDRLTVLAGRLAPASSTHEVMVTPGVARLLGLRVGRTITYDFFAIGPGGQPSGPPVTRSYRVAAIVEAPPALVDQADTAEGSILPPAATRQVLYSYQYGTVGLDLRGGAAGIPALQRHLATLAATLQQQASRAAHQDLSGLFFPVTRPDVIHGQVQASIRPEAIALSVFAGVAALAVLVLVGQGLAQLVSRSAPDVAVLRALGASRARIALAVGLPGVGAVLGGAILAVAGAIALSPLAPVGPVRRYDPDRGLHLDAPIVGTGAALFLVLLLGLLAVLILRSIRPGASQAEGRPSAVVRAAVAAGLPPTAVVGTRNALEPGAGVRSVPVRSTLLGSIIAVAAVVSAVVFGASLTGLISHPVRYGWNWNVIIQAQGGYGSFNPAIVARVMRGQPAVAAWSEFSFAQLSIDGRVLPVMGVQPRLGTVEPPTVSGQPLGGPDQVELGAGTLAALGKKVGDTVRIGAGPDTRTARIAGVVTLPSFGLATADHVSLGRGAMLPEATLRAAEGAASGSSGAESQPTLPSTIAIDLAPGTTTAQRARLVSQIVTANPDQTPGGTYELRSALAAAIVNTRQMGGQPVALALGLAAAAVLSLSLTVLSSVRRRRRELALLKALGMTRGQLRSVIAWQTTLTLLIAVAIGGPLGVAGGRLAWQSFAGSLGAMTVTEIPVAGLILGLLALVLAGNLLATGPAAIAARIRPAIALRAE